MFGKRLKKLRDREGISQQKLADIVGLTQQAIAKWESSKAEPDLATVAKLAEFFNTTTDYILCRSIVRTPIDTIAAHHDGDEFTEEELKDIEKFKEFVKMKRGKKEKE